MKYRNVIIGCITLSLFSCEKDETSKYDGYLPVYPQKIYTVCHEGGASPSGLPVLYLDHLFYLGKHVPFSFSATGNDRFPFAGQDGEAQSADIQETNVPIGINGCSIPVAVTRVSTKSTVGKGRQIRLLPIGDSVGAGQGGDWNRPEGRASVSWSVARQFFMQDRYADGTYPQETGFITIGTVGKNTFEVSTPSGTAVCTGYGECRGGWKLVHYLYSRFIGGTENPFYDESLLGKNKFSLAAYLKRFRTHDDAGNRLPDTPPGSDAYVNTPTHVIIQLGLNDPFSLEYKEQISSMISRIKEEFPDMVIGLSLTDASGTCFPEFYSGYDFSAQAMSLSGEKLHYKCRAWNIQLQQLEDPDKKIFYIPAYYIQPTAESVPYEQQDSGLKIPAYDDSHYHPNSNAHYAWGYQIYAWLKYTLALSGNNIE